MLANLRHISKLSFKEKSRATKNHITRKVEWVLFLFLKIFSHWFYRLIPRGPFPFPDLQVINIDRINVFYPMVRLLFECKIIPEMETRKPVFFQTPFAREFHEMLLGLLCSSGCVICMNQNFVFKVSSLRLFYRWRNQGALANGNFKRYIKLKKIVEKGGRSSDDTWALDDDHDFCTSDWMHSIRKLRGRNLGKMIRINRPLNLAIDMGGACGGMLLGMKEEKMFKQGFVCDLPKVRNIAEKRIGESPFKTELRFIECNFLQNNFPQGADLITFAHVFHDWREKVVRKLIDKAYRALKTDGYILVVEYYLDEDRLGPYPACQQNYFVWLDSSGGKQYTGNEIAKWLAEAGFKNILVCSKFLNTSEGYILGTK